VLIEKGRVLPNEDLLARGHRARPLHLSAAHSAKAGARARP
jgi:hypothetical protein